MTAGSPGCPLPPRDAAWRTVVYKNRDGVPQRVDHGVRDAWGCEVPGPAP
jgi:hypothetical protein